MTHPPLSVNIPGKSAKTLDISLLRERNLLLSAKPLSHAERSRPNPFSAKSIPLNIKRCNLRTGALDAPPAKLPVGTHEVQIVDGNIMVIESDEAPNLPPA